MDKRNRMNIILVVLGFSILLLAGCGGGGGGRGGEPNGPVMVLTLPAANTSVTDVEFNDEAFRLEITYVDETGINITTLSASIKVDSGSAVDISSYFSASGSNKLVTTNIYEVTQTLFDVRLNDQTRTVTVAITLADELENTGQMSAQFTVIPGGSGDGDTPPAPPAS